MGMVDSPFTSCLIEHVHDILLQVLVSVTHYFLQSEEHGDCSRGLLFPFLIPEVWLCHQEMIPDWTVIMNFHCARVLCMRLWSTHYWIWDPLTPYNCLLNISWHAIHFWWSKYRNINTI